MSRKLKKKLKKRTISKRKTGIRRSNTFLIVSRAFQIKIFQRVHRRLWFFDIKKKCQKLKTKLKSPKVVNPSNISTKIRESLAMLRRKGKSIKQQGANETVHRIANITENLFSLDQEKSVENHDANNKVNETSNGTETLPSLNQSGDIARNEIAQEPMICSPGIVNVPTTISAKNQIVEGLKTQVEEINEKSITVAATAEKNIEKENNTGIIFEDLLSEGVLGQDHLKKDNLDKISITFNSNSNKDEIEKNNSKESVKEDSKTADVDDSEKMLDKTSINFKNLTSEKLGDNVTDTEKKCPQSKDEPQKNSIETERFKDKLGDEDEDKLKEIIIEDTKNGDIKDGENKPHGTQQNLSGKNFEKDKNAIDGKTDSLMPVEHYLKENTVTNDDSVKTVTSKQEVGVNEATDSITEPGKMTSGKDNISSENSSKNQTMQVAGVERVDFAGVEEPSKENALNGNTETKFNNESMLNTLPAVEIEIPKQSAFLSNELDNFLTSNIDLNVSYEIPKLKGMNHVKTLNGVLPLKSTSSPKAKKRGRPSSTASYNSSKISTVSKFKPRTLADKRRIIEMDQQKKILHYVEMNEESIFSKLKRCARISRRATLENICDDLHKTSLPVTQHCWLTAVNTFNRSEVIYWKDKKIRFNGNLRGLCIDLNKINKSVESAKRKISRQVYSITKDNFKPGPLSKKTTLARDGRLKSRIIVVPLSKVTLEVKPCCKKTFPLTVDRYLHDQVDELGYFSKEYANFAATAVDDNSLEHNFEFPIKYQYTNKMLMYKCTTFQPASLKDFCTLALKREEAKKTSQFDEVKAVMDDILDYFERPKLENSELSFCPDCPEFADKPKEIEKSKVKKRPKSLKHNPLRELKRLNVQVVDLIKMSNQNDEQICGDACKLGCVCYDKSVLISSSNHCGKVECLFECTCEEFQSSNTNLYREKNSLSNEAICKIDTEMRKKLAKEERQFTQTVICSNDQTIVIGEVDRLRRKRCAKAPSKYEDFFQDFQEQRDEIQPATKVTSIETPKRAKVDILEIPEIKEPTLVLEDVQDFEESQILCIVHELYNCFCNGRSLSDYFDFGQSPVVENKTSTKDSVIINDTKLNDNKKDSDASAVVDKGQHVSNNKRSCDTISPEKNERNLQEKRRKLLETTPEPPVIAHSAEPLTPLTKSPNWNFVKDSPGYKLYNMPDLFKPPYNVRSSLCQIAIKSENTLCEVRLMNWSKLLQHTKTNTINVCYDPKKKVPIIIPIESALPKGCVYLKDIPAKDIPQLPNPVKSLVKNKLPSSSSDIESTNAICIFNGQYWKICGSMERVRSLKKSNDKLKDPQLEIPSVKAPSGKNDVASYHTNVLLNKMLDDTNAKVDKAPFPTIRTATSNDAEVTEVNTNNTSVATTKSNDNVPDGQVGRQATLKIASVQSSIDNKKTKLINDDSKTLVVDLPRCVINSYYFYMLSLENFQSLIIMDALLASKISCAKMKNLSLLACHKQRLIRQRLAIMKNKFILCGFACREAPGKLFIGPYPNCENHHVKLFKIQPKDDAVVRGMWITKIGDTEENLYRIVAIDNITTFEYEQPELLIDLSDDLMDGLNLESNPPCDNVPTDLNNDVEFVSAKPPGDEIDFEDVIPEKMVICSLESPDSINQESVATKNVTPVNVSTRKKKKLVEQDNVPMKVEATVKTDSPEISQSAVGTVTIKSLKTLMASNVPDNPSPNTTLNQSTDASTTQENRIWWLIPEIKSLGYLSVKKVDDSSYQLFIPGILSPLLFDKFPSLVAWFQTFLKHHMIFVPSNLEVRFRMARSLNDTGDCSPARAEYFAGNYILQKDGVKNLQNLSLADINNLDLRMQNKKKLLDKKKKMVLENCVHTFGKAFLKPEMLNQMDLSEILLAAVAAIRVMESQSTTLEKEKKELLEEQDKLRKTLESLSSNKSFKVKNKNVVVEFDDASLVDEFLHRPSSAQIDSLKDDLRTSKKLVPKETISFVKKPVAIPQVSKIAETSNDDVIIIDDDSDDDKPVITSSNTLAMLENRNIDEHLTIRPARLCPPKPVQKLRQFGKVDVTLLKKDSPPLLTATQPKSKEPALADTIKELAKRSNVKINVNRDNKVVAGTSLSNNSNIEPTRLKLHSFVKLHDLLQNTPSSQKKPFTTENPDRIKSPQNIDPDTTATPKNRTFYDVFMDANYRDQKNLFTAIFNENIIPSNNSSTQLDEQSTSKNVHNPVTAGPTNRLNAPPIVIQTPDIVRNNKPKKQNQNNQPRATNIRAVAEKKQLLSVTPYNVPTINLTGNAPAQIVKLPGKTPAQMVTILGNAHAKTTKLAENTPAQIVKLVGQKPPPPQPPRKLAPLVNISSAPLTTMTSITSSTASDIRNRRMSVCGPPSSNAKTFGNNMPPHVLKLSSTQLANICSATSTATTTTANSTMPASKNRRMSVCVQSGSNKPVFIVPSSIYILNPDKKS